jgi:hypothetical protein
VLPTCDPKIASRMMNARITPPTTVTMIPERMFLNAKGFSEELISNILIVAARVNIIGL